MPLSDQQSFILEKFKEGKNIFITGMGGTGKTFLIKEIRKIAEEKDNKILEEDDKQKITCKKTFQVCAMTGCAAVLLECGANTLHSWTGLGLARGTIEEIVARVVNSKYRRKNWLKTNILIIDEVSMLSNKLLTILDLIGRRVKKRLNIPFGGMQVIFSGDFYQLPPIGEPDDIMSNEFCFENILWNTIFEEQIELSIIFRQKDDRYKKILSQIRECKIKKSSLKALEERIRTPPDDLLIKPPILLSRRKDAEKINTRENKLLSSEECNCYKLEEITEKKFDEKIDKEKEKYSKGEIEFEVNYLKNNILAEQELNLKIGTQVMCIANIDIEGTNSIVNGSQGIVVEFKNKLPVVEFKNREKRLINFNMWKSEILQGIAIKQIPLIHSWAITIHKSQGITLDTAQIDLGNSIFESGQSYVALSRVVSLEGLYLLDFKLEGIKVFKKVENFYKNFKA